MSVLHIAQYRMKGHPNWNRLPCLHADCKRASVRGRLCSKCAEHVIAVTAELLRPFGHDVDFVTLQDGYVMVTSRDRTVRNRGAHRVVMEGVLGRRLRTIENVHHLNGNRADNRPENLELWVSSQPSGQRPADLVLYARELLSMYGDPDEQGRYARRSA